VDKDAVANAISVLRESGLRIPSALAKRVSAIAGYTPNRADLKAFEKRVTGLLPSQKLIVKVSRKGGRLVIYSDEAFDNLERNATHAREVKAQNKVEVANGNN
jgi:hypothetical protein